MIGFVFAAVDVHTIINVIGYSEYLSDSHAASTARSSYRLFSNFMILGSALYSASIASAKEKGFRKLVLVSILAAPVVAYAIFLSSRNTFFVLFIIHVSVFLAFKPGAFSGSRPMQAFRLRKSVFQTLAVLSTLLVVVLLFFISVTEQRYGKSDSEYNQVRREAVVFYAFDGAFGNDENMLWLRQHNDFELLLGKTYLAGLLVVIPKQLWPEKPLGAGPELINMVRPGSYIRGEDGNNSLTTGLITEAFMNFGDVGAFGSILLWAFFSSRAIRGFRKSKNIFFRTGFILTALLLSSSLLFQEFLGFFARLIVIVAPLFLLGVLSKARWSKQNRIMVSS
jgi:oligosaccharide repeat unit polymerase